MISRVEVIAAGQNLSGNIGSDFRQVFKLLEVTSAIKSLRISVHDLFE